MDWLLSADARAGLAVSGAVTLAMLFAACAIYEPVNGRPLPFDSGASLGDSGSGGGTGRSLSPGKAISNAGNDGRSDGAESGVSTGTGGEGGEGGEGGPSDIDTAIGSDVVTDVAIEADRDTGPPLTCAGFALQFDGLASYAVVMRVVQDDFTLEAWIKTEAPSLMGTSIWEGSGLLYADQPYANNPAGADDFGTSMLDGKFAFGVGNPDTTLLGATNVNTGAWVHIAATRQKSTGTLRVIVNGVLDGTRTVAAQNRSLTAPPYIMLGANIIDGRYWKGTMDEVRMWSIVRSPADIAATMHKTLVGNEPGLVGYWKFDDGSGVTSADSSPTKLDATLISAPRYVRSDVPVCP